MSHSCLFGIGRNLLYFPSLEKFPLDQKQAQLQHLFDKAKEFNSVTQNQEQLDKKVVLLMKNEKKEAIKKPVYETTVCKEKANISK